MGSANRKRPSVSLELGSLALDGSDSSEVDLEQLSTEVIMAAYLGAPATVFGGITSWNIIAHFGSSLKMVQHQMV